MNPQDTELMNRYIYQVTRRLPVDQRNEIGLELQELISDMAEDSGSMDEILMKLGDPAELAKKYQDTSHHLIGPEYYDTYLWFLRTVLICALIPVLVMSIFETVKNSSISAVVNILSNTFITGISVFGGITLMFAVMERQKIRFDLKIQSQWSVNDLGDNFSGGNRGWSPKALTPLPHKKAILHRSDSIASIVFIVIFCIFLIFAPHLFSALTVGEALMTEPIFNMEYWNIILPLFIIAMVISLIDEVVRLVHGHYCIPVMISSIVCGGLQIIIGFILLKVFRFVNPNFILQIQAALGEKPNDFGNFLAQIGGETLNNVLFIFIFLVTVLEVGVAVYKTMRYGHEKSAGQ